MFPPQSPESGPHTQHDTGGMKPVKDNSERVAVTPKAFLCQIQFFLVANICYNYEKCRFRE